MKVFISWSGDASKGLAEHLRTWLPRVLISHVQVFVSSQDIEKGRRGLSVIAANLEEIEYGLILLTSSNQHAPWINFEAGAIGKSMGESRVSPLLVDLTQSDVIGPLQQFQMTSLSDREDVWKLLGDMNKLLASPVPPEPLKVLFDDAWPGLEVAIALAQEGQGPAKTTRPAEDMLDEILYRVRQLDRRSRVTPTRMGPSGLTRDEEQRLVNEVFSAVSASSAAELRGGIKVGTAGAVVTISAPENTYVDRELLQDIANLNGIRVEIAELGILIEPQTQDGTGKQ